MNAVANKDRCARDGPWRASIPTRRCAATCWRNYELSTRCAAANAEDCAPSSEMCLLQVLFHAASPVRPAHPSTSTMWPTRWCAARQPGSGVLAANRVAGGATAQWSSASSGEDPESCMDDVPTGNPRCPGPEGARTRRQCRASRRAVPDSWAVRIGVDSDAENDLRAPFWSSWTRAPRRAGGRSARAPTVSRTPRGAHLGRGVARPLAARRFGETGLPGAVAEVSRPGRRVSPHQSRVWPSQPPSATPGSIANVADPTVVIHGFMASASANRRCTGTNWRSGARR